MTVDEEDEDEDEEEEEESTEVSKESAVRFEEPKTKAEAEETDEPTTGRRLDLEVEASGFGRAMQRELEDVSKSLRAAKWGLMK